MDSLSRYRWRKAHETEKFLGEAFLKKFEKYCVAACARYRNLNFVEDHAWMLASVHEEAAAMILHSRRTIFPVLNGREDICIPAYLSRTLSNIKIHALHGTASDVVILQKLLRPLGFEPVEQMDYYLLALDSKNDLCKIKTMPKGLLLRRPKPGDLERLLPLQCGYEQEEVLPAGAVLDPRNSKINLKRILTKERLLVAELNGRVAGKINTNAEAYSRCQIGGVYVLPEYRRQGIASCMTAAFARLLLVQGYGMTLFVREKNKAALNTYLGAGFKIVTGYRIVYY